MDKRIRINNIRREVIISEEKISSAQAAYLPCADTTPAVVGAAAESIYLIQTRLRYSPVLVSIWTLSPWFTNSGTLICAPVSTVAGFVAP